MEATINNYVQQKTDFFHKKVITELPIEELQVEAGGVSTSYLEGGQGTPLILIHGPGESAVWWVRVIPYLVKKFHVIVPDLPGHGSSGSPDKKYNKQFILEWLDEFLHKTCATEPILVGHVVGGAIAARYAAHHSSKLKQVVLVDSLGLSSFRPAPRFAFEFLRFIISPEEKSYLRFLPQCIYDVNLLSKEMGQFWQPFLDYNVHTARNPEKKAAAKAIMEAMKGKIPEDMLKKITIPVSLIWGRHDKANRLKVAIKASEKYGWPLRIIEDTRDDPKLEKPEAFTEALQVLLEKPVLEEKLSLGSE